MDKIPFTQNPHSLKFAQVDKISFRFLAGRTNLLHVFCMEDKIPFINLYTLNLHNFSYTRNLNPECLIITWSEMMTISPCSNIHLYDIVKVKFTPFFYIIGKGSTKHCPPYIGSITWLVNSSKLKSTISEWISKF